MNTQASPAPSSLPDAAPTGLRRASTIAFLGAAATAVMAVGHAGVEIPIISALGPGGGRAVWPAAGAFALAAAGYAGVAVGLRHRQSWAVPVGALLFGITIVAAMVPYRGIGSLLGAALGATGLVFLSLTALRRWNGWIGRGGTRGPTR